MLPIGEGAPNSMAPIYSAREDVTSITILAIDVSTLVATTRLRWRSQERMRQP